MDATPPASATRLIPRAENDVAFNAIAAHFRATHPGGRAEPIGADEITRASTRILEGADILS
ncbi:hypothetical protein [Acidiphilium sp.]|uniref:hypothetical protein n=1 Tax=Acidiphilium sp. TaxID=527 RepID=UPI003D042924